MDVLGKRKVSESNFRHSKQPKHYSISGLDHLLFRDIFSFLPTEDILRASTTCTDFRKVLVGMLEVVTLRSCASAMHFKPHMYKNLRSLSCR